MKKPEEVFRSFLSGLVPLPRRIYNLAGSSLALFLSLTEAPFLLVGHTEESSERVWKDMLFYMRLLGESESGVFLLKAANGAGMSGARADIVRKAGEEGFRAVITSEEAARMPLWARDELAQRAMGISKGTAIEREGIERRLDEMGYVRVPIVTEKGQYRLKGWLLDVFPSTCEMPVRVEFFGDNVEDLRVFDIETQRSVSEAGEVVVMPASEPEAGVDVFEFFKGAKVFFSAMSEEGLPEDGTLLSEFPFEGEGARAGALTISGKGILPGERKGMGELTGVLAGALAGGLNDRGEAERIMLVCSSSGQAERLKEILSEGGLTAPIVEIEEIASHEGRLSITVGELSAGLYMTGLLILTEREIFGERPAFRPLRKSKVSGLLNTLEDLRAGDYVVHEDHGIGRFLCLERKSTEGYECELMTIEYAGGDRVHVPLQGIGKIHKHHLSEGGALSLDSLGSRRWQARKERARKKIREMAGRLLRVYSEREVVKGFAFSPDTELHREFDGFFSYEETPDQTRSASEIKADMESERPMDRLLSGDVGYGKTEVAMRAAFKAVYDGKQVAVLVPTTLLCEQHFRNFRMRFSAFPVKVDFISRFKSKKEQSKTVHEAESGQVDILIGTHGLLNVSFPDPGLLIVDEEHRFGVGQKERIKEMKRGVDSLTISATPIPRTIQMALSGIWNMSVIDTPPEERLSVKTVVSSFDEAVIKEAVERELERGGQVYFVHNRIEGIEKYLSLLRRLVPGATCELAHGRMRVREVEEVMLGFVDGKIDVLVTTAIVGSGIDVPNANTIIINRADMMGLADLYQLRGRVGRGNVRAYGYFLIPGEDLISGQAKERLSALKELSYLGAGFRLALKDLEIRGAGNLLGAEQSGYIDDMGFDVYIEMLEEAVAELRGVGVPETPEPHVSLRVDAFIPEDYVGDEMLRLGLYRRISLSRALQELKDISGEMKDRFGPPPEDFMNLLRTMELRIIGRALKVKEILQRGDLLRFTFHPGAQASAEDIMKVFDKKARFLPDGFEFKTESTAASEIFLDAKNALLCLSTGGAHGQ